MGGGEVLMPSKPARSLTDQEIEEMLMAGRQIQRIRLEVAKINTETLAKMLGWKTDSTVVQIEAGRWRMEGERRRPNYSPASLDQIIVLFEEQGWLEKGKLSIPFQYNSIRKKEGWSSGRGPKALLPDENLAARMRALEADLAKKEAQLDTAQASIARLERERDSAIKRSELAENQRNEALRTAHEVAVEDSKPEALQPMVQAEIQQLILELGLDSRLQLTQQQITRLLLAVGRDGAITNEAKSQVDPDGLILQLTVLSEHLKKLLGPVISIVSTGIGKDSKQADNTPLIIIERCKRMIRLATQVVVWIAAIRRGGATQAKAVAQMIDYFKPKEENRAERK